MRPEYNNVILDLVLSVILLEIRTTIVAFFVVSKSHVGRNPNMKWRFQLLEN